MTDLKTLQREVAKMLTDASYRSTVIASLDVEPTEVTTSNPISGLSQDELQRSSQTLHRKRLSQTRFAMPLTSEVLGECFEPLFLEFSQDRHFDGHKAWAIDVIEFSIWLGVIAQRDHHASIDSFPDWLPDLARWESMATRWFTARYFVLIFRYRYDISSWSRNRKSDPMLRVNYWLVARAGRRSLFRHVW